MQEAELHSCASPTTETHTGRRGEAWDHNNFTALFPPLRYTEWLKEVTVSRLVICAADKAEVRLWWIEGSHSYSHSAQPPLQGILFHNNKVIMKVAPRPQSSRPFIPDQVCWTWIEYATPPHPTWLGLETQLKRKSGKGEKKGLSSTFFSTSFLLHSWVWDR